MSENKAIIVETKYGTREVVPTPYIDKDTGLLKEHLYVGHDGYAGHTAKFLGPIRGISYHVSAHLFKRLDGSWKIGEHADYGYNYEVLTEGAGGSQVPDQWKYRQENHSNLYATRSVPFSIEDASKSARLALGAAIEEAVNKWARTPEGQARTRAARSTAISGALDAAMVAREAAKTALVDAEKEVKKASRAVEQDRRVLA